MQLRDAETRDLTISGVASLALEVDGKAFPPVMWMALGAIANLPFGPGKEYTFPIFVSYCAAFCGSPAPPSATVGGGSAPASGDWAAGSEL